MNRMKLGLLLLAVLLVTTCFVGCGKTETPKVLTVEEAQQNMIKVAKTMGGIDSTIIGVAINLAESPNRDWGQIDSMFHNVTQETREAYYLWRATIINDGLIGRR